MLGDDDTFEDHLADTVEVGCGLVDEDVARRVIEGGPGSVARLEGLGARFDRREDGRPDLSMEGGHSHARILHAQGDSTGKEIQGTLGQAIEDEPGIDVFTEMFGIDVLSDDSGRTVGVLCRNHRGELTAYGASQVVLATGGGGQIYRETQARLIDYAGDFVLSMTPPSSNSAKILCTERSVMPIWRAKLRTVRAESRDRQTITWV